MSVQLDGSGQHLKTFPYSQQSVLLAMSDRCNASRGFAAYDAREGSAPLVATRNQWCKMSRFK